MESQCIVNPEMLREPAPAGKWSVILCRNLAIYLRPDAKARLHERLSAALAPGGVLLVGRSERIMDSARIGLAPVAPHAYRRVA